MSLGQSWLGWIGRSVNGSATTFTRHELNRVEGSISTLDSKLNKDQLSSSAIEKSSNAGSSLHTSSDLQPLPG